jgi:hypothetical protein
MDFSTKFKTGITILSIIVVAGCQTITPTTPVTTFDECVDAGYDIWQTMPLECRTPEGEVFIIDAELEPTSPT